MVGPDSNHKEATSLNSMDEHRLSTLDYVIAGVFALIVLVVCAQVLSRFFQSFAWTQEVSCYLFVWLTFLGAAAAVRDGTHVAVEFLVDRLPTRTERIIKFGVVLVMTAFLAILTILGALLVRETSGTSSPALGLPVNWVSYSALPIAAFMGTAYGGWRLWRLARPKPGEEDAK